MSNTPWGRSKKIDKSKGWSGIDVHPRPGRRLRLDKGPDLPPSGGVDGLEHKFIRCKQCGFINNTMINQPGSGWGNENALITTNPTMRDVETGAGCALCGSSEYGG